MALTLIGGAKSAAYAAEVKAASDRIADGCGCVLIWDTRDGGREFLALGEVDADAVAGYAARCLASLANGG